MDPVFALLFRFPGSPFGGNTLVWVNPMAAPLRLSYRPINAHHLTGRRYTSVTSPPACWRLGQQRDMTEGIYLGISKTPFIITPPDTILS